MTDEFASTLPAATVSCNVSAAARIAIVYAHVDRRVRVRASINSGRSRARLLLRIINRFGRSVFATPILLGQNLYLLGNCPMTGSNFVL